MMRLTNLSFFALLAFACCLPACVAEEVTKEQAQADAAKVQDLHKQHYPAFEGIYGGIAVGETSEPGILAECEKLQQKLKVLNEIVLPVLEPFMAQFEARYNKDNDPEWVLKQLGVAESFEASNRFRDLARAMENVGKTRLASAEYLSGYVQNGSEITFFVPDKRVPVLQQRKLFLQWAQKFDPGNAYANARLATIDQEIADLQNAIEKEIDAKAWAGHTADFPGPGAATDLARAALSFLRQSTQWGAAPKPVEVLAVAVRGPWQVAEKDFFGRVTSWRLPVHLAVTRPDDRTRNVARVYELSLVTVQAAPGAAQKAPPFDGYWVGDSWMMRLSKLPQTP